MFDYICITIFAIVILFIMFLILHNNNIVVSILLLNLLSFSSAICYLLLKAIDVAITEIAVGSSISTVFFLFSAKFIIGKNEFIKKNKTHQIYNIIKNIYLFIISMALFILLSFSISNIDSFGNSDKIIDSSNKPSTYYLINTEKELGMKSIVTGTLASYRGFDTMIENFVIFTASIGVLFILSNKEKSSKS